MTLPAEIVTVPVVIALRSRIPAATLMAFVRTVSPLCRQMLRATCVAVVPAPMASVSPSETSSAAARPMRRFSALRWRSCSW